MTTGPKVHVMDSSWHWQYQQISDALKEYVTGLNPHGEKYEHLLPLTFFERNSKDFKRTYCINALFLADVHLAIKLVYKHVSLMTKGLFLKRSEILGATTSFVSSQR